MVVRDRYSRTVFWLKILLPVAALGILSTLFLLSRSIDPTETIPFAKNGLNNRTNEEQVNQPQLSGASKNGDLLSFKADSARAVSGQKGVSKTTNPAARIDFANGNTMTFTASTGRLNDGLGQAELSGDVVIRNSQGYTLTSDHLTTRINTVGAESPGPVQGTGPLGDITAGSMLLSDTPDTKDPQLLFQNGVKVIYDPTRNKD